MIAPPEDLEQTLDRAWSLTKHVPGFLGENEARFLGLLVACTPATGAILEIGSFKGRSTVMMASVAAHYGLGPVVAVDPHTQPAVTDRDIVQGSSTFDEFIFSVRSTGLDNHVEVHRALSGEVAGTWRRPLRFLWIDGDHTYAGCKADFDNFSHYLSDHAVVALHDSLNAFEGPIRVVVEDILRSDRFGPAGFVHSIAWSQYRPADGAWFREERSRLERRAVRLLPFVERNRTPKGLAKIAYKLNRFRVPRSPISPADWTASVSRTSGHRRL